MTGKQLRLQKGMLEKIFTTDVFLEKKNTRKKEKPGHGWQPFCVSASADLCGMLSDGRT